MSNLTANEFMRMRALELAIKYGRSRSIDSFPPADVLACAEKFEKFLIPEVKGPAVPHTKSIFTRRNIKDPAL